MGFRGSPRGFHTLLSSRSHVGNTCRHPARHFWGMSTAAVTEDALAALDESGPNRQQLKIMLVSGMGFFTDAYDLFIIGVAVAILKTRWHLSTPEVSLLASTTLAASALGAALFGRVADILGRKRIYGV